VETSEIRSNKDKLLLAAIDLMAEKGYNGVSTKEIAAAAGVSEMTLFRNFGSKKNLLGAAVDRYYYIGEMKALFADQIVWDLRMDLLLISRTYHEIMNRNRQMILIVLKEHTELAALRDRANKHPKQLQEMLTQYFQKMQDQGKLIPTNSEAQAVAFLWMNYGAFMSNLYGANITQVTMQEFIQSSIELFARALTP
jgi:TetR/AcrR family transcriptional repressor of mexJK operon